MFLFFVVNEAPEDSMARGTLWVGGPHMYRGADKFLALPGRKQAIVSVRMAWISFGSLPCRKKKTWWQLASRCCWNRARPQHASELVSFLVGLRTYQHKILEFVVGSFEEDSVLLTEEIMIQAILICFLAREKT